jgi:diguanylate cyclase (GGDEF)-like protein
METGQRGFCITQKDEFLEPYNTGGKEFDALIEKEQKLVSDNPRQVAALQRVEHLVGEWKQIAARREINEHPETFKDVAALLQAGTGKVLLDQIRRELDEFIVIETRLAAERYSIASETITWTRNLAACLLIFAICVGALVAILISHAIARPLVELAAGAQSIGSGDLDTQVKVRSFDEIGVLARAFNAMASNLREAASMHRQAEAVAAARTIELKQRTIELEKSRRIAMGMMEDAHLAKETAEHDAAHDSLTGLANRAQFTKRLEQAIEQHRDSNEYRFALLFLDIDRFKVINDSLGHVAGDKLAGRLSNALRQSRADRPVSKHDLVARLGGDEFAILIGDISSVEDASEVADRLQQKIVKPFDIDGHEVVISASIGIVTNEYDYTNPQDMIRDADNAMYHAKAAGRARYQVFDQTMHANARARLELENDLRIALQRRELFMLYQPLVCMESGRLLGFEALVRWQHTQRGIISPVEFIPIAEETGLIVPIGQWVLEQACAQASAWLEQFPDHRDMTINVNVSRAQLAQPGLPQHVQKVLEQTRLDPKHLALEVTESVMMEAHDIVDDTLRELTRLNVPLHLDDFGTGQSSLSQLHELPIDALKIDGAFVANMAHRIEYPAIVQTIITLAHNLGMSVIAEGIETPAQLVQLQTLECDIGQGFYFARPLSVAAATTMLDDGLSLAKSA